MLNDTKKAFSGLLKAFFLFDYQDYPQIFHEASACPSNIA